ncbi:MULTISPECIES: hypothetical protein [Streptomyces]|uniref:hypothetical protein n=1 Tax=Streptomyces TaxID=1883 RepID=UPI000A93CE55|nr:MULTISPECIES: hypothetical protein [Streptomyces]
MCRTTLAERPPAGFDRERICDALTYARRPGLRCTAPDSRSAARAVLHKALTSLRVYGETYLQSLPVDAREEREELRRFLDVVREWAGRRAVPRQILIDIVERMVELADAVRAADGRSVSARDYSSEGGPKTAPEAATDT